MLATGRGNASATKGRRHLLASTKVRSSIRLASCSPPGPGERQKGLQAGEPALADDIHLVAQNLLLHARGRLPLGRGGGRRSGRVVELVLEQADGAAEAGDGGGVGLHLLGVLLGLGAGDVRVLGVAGLDDLSGERSVVGKEGVTEVCFRGHC
ncbi:hypothetical protein BR93DRAFT_84578 [Coniochaeta sp. PMI_546]|nr:hypothetical protein BR93DRAFT_84578 [Coniochaeta sp. PMI_546]